MTAITAFFQSFEKKRQFSGQEDLIYIFCDGVAHAQHKRLTSESQRFF